MGYICWFREIQVFVWVPESRGSSAASVWDHNKMRGAIVSCKQSLPPTCQSLVPLVLCFPPKTCASRLSREQARVRALWRQATSLRSTFTQLRTFTDRWVWPTATAPPATQDSTGTPTFLVSHTHMCNHNPSLCAKVQSGTGHQVFLLIVSSLWGTDGLRCLLSLWKSFIKAKLEPFKILLPSCWTTACTTEEQFASTMTPQLIDNSDHVSGCFATQTEHTSKWALIPKLNHCRHQSRQLCN